MSKLGATIKFSNGAFNLGTKLVKGIYNVFLG